MQKQQECGKSKKKQRKKIPYQYCPEGLDTQIWQTLLRKQIAKEEKLQINCVDEVNAPGEYRVRNPKTEQIYKVVYRGAKSPWNYCSCLDFKTSRLGTCKHLEALKQWFNKRHHVRKEIPPYTSVYLDYNGERRVRIRIGSDNEDAFRELASKYFDEEAVLLEDSYNSFNSFLKAAKTIDNTFRCYNDAMEFVLEHRERKAREIWVDSLNDNDFSELLNTRLYPYQEEGIRFAVKAGRSIIADEMGLGKTIQAIGAAELLRKKGLAASVLILCPTSLKYQWKREIERFTGQDVLVIEGNSLQRQRQYTSDETYKIVSYNAMNNDVRCSGGIDCDMLIIDEVQRLKNWNTQIAVSARKIRSRYAVILSGTPLENRLEELYSVMELVDNFCLAPFYKFRERYIISDDKGGTAGYRHLNEIGDRLKPYLIRRKKNAVRLQMPARQDKNLMVPMTKEQLAIHNECRFQVSLILKKWERMHFLSETDRNRLILLLSQMRMVCDSTYIIDQKTRNDTKVDEVANIIRNVVEDGNDKIVIFSQWERMTRLIAKEMDKMKVGYSYLHGGVPSKARKDLVNNFTDNPDCKVFLSTDAGCTGLNLQAASIIINMDLPWNPAVLEQRIARIYRLGQPKNIEVINLVSANTFEEEMLGKLRFKSSMFEGVLDGGEDTIFATENRFKKMMDNLCETINNSPETAQSEPPIDKEETEQNIEDTKPDDSDGFEDIPAENDDYEEDIVSGITDKAANTAVQQTENNDIQPPRHTNNSPNRGTMSSPKHIVEQGVAFLSGLSEILKSPQSTKEFIDSIVEEDRNTGETHIKIPVPDKNTVAQLLELAGKLFRQ